MRDRSTVGILNDLGSGGGVERIVSQMVTRVFLAEEATLLLFEAAAEQSWARGAVTLGVPVPPYASLFKEASAIWQATRSLRRAKKHHHIAVCVSHKEGPNFANVLSGGTRTVVTVHEAKSEGMKYRGFKRWLARTALRLLYNRADRVVTVSAGIAADLATNFGINPKKLRVIRNPCDIVSIAGQAQLPPPPGLERRAGHPTLVNVGRLETQKGQWHLIRAFSHIRAALPAARLVIVGTGDHLGQLRQLTADLKLEDAVIFTGFLANPHAVMAQADLFILSSLWEGFPLVLAEAMACGLPVIATDSPTGAREILDPSSAAGSGSASAPEFGEFGVLTPPLCGGYLSAKVPLTLAETALAHASIALLNDQKLRETYAARGAQRCTQFSLQAFAEHWRELLAEFG